MPDPWNHANLAIIRALLSIVIVGFVLVGFALLLLRWPIGAGDQAVQQITRLAGSDDNGANLIQRLPDLAIYLIVIAGIAFLVLAIRRGERSLLLGLVGIGFLGLAYAGGMALYIGPMVSVCGFMLILFGGMVAWATTGPREAEDTENMESAGTTESPESPQRYKMQEAQETNETGAVSAADYHAPAEPGDTSQSE